MKLTFKTLVISLLSSLLIFPSVSYSKTKTKKKSSSGYSSYYSNEIRNKKYHLENTKSELQKKKKIVEELKKKEDDASFALSIVQKKLENTSIKLADSAFRYEQTQRQIKVTDTRLKEKEKELQKQMLSTNLTLTRLYKYRYVDFLMFLLNSNDLSTFMRRSVYLNYLIKQDNDLINSVKNQKKEIRDLKDEYTKKKVQIASIAKKMAVQKTIYEDQTEQQQEYLHQIQTKKEVYEKEVKLLENESDRISSMLKALISAQKRAGSSKKGGNAKYYSGPIYTGGRMGWPCASTNLTSYYGYRVHPIFGTRKLHTGIDVGADSGTAIYAAASGTVVESGWTGGYGKAVIIDHGGGIATLYGHTSVLYVAPGQRVKRGQLIAAVGSTGFSTGPHLHFEVRLNGSPVDPLAYLR